MITEKSLGLDTRELTIHIADLSLTHLRANRKLISLSLNSSESFAGK